MKCVLVYIGGLLLGAATASAWWAAGLWGLNGDDMNPYDAIAGMASTIVGIATFAAIALKWGTWE